MAAPILKTKPTNAIALIRKSTNVQDNARQRTDIERLKKKFGLNIVQTIELDGVSGRKVLKDPRFRQILEDIAQRSDVHGLALSAIDRFFRTDRYSDPSCFQPLADHHKVIWSAREGEVEAWTDEGFDVCMTAALKSGAEWREIRRRSMDGKLEKAEEGFLPHSIPWFGVDIIGRRQTGIIGKGKAVINEREAAAALEVFQLRAAGGPGSSRYALARMLNERGILGKGSHGKDPVEWSTVTIGQMLKSTNYIGKHMWNGIEIPVPRIVDDELFYAVQAIGKQIREQRAGRPTKLPHLLHRFLFCLRCKHRCSCLRSSGSSKNPKRIYWCGHRTNKPPVRRLCNAPQVSAELLEAIVWSAIWGMLKNAELLLEMGRNHYAEQGTSVKTDQLEKEMQRLQQKDRNLSNLMEDATSDQEYSKHRSKRNEVRARMASVEVAMRAAPKVINLPPLQMLKMYIRRITAGPEPSTYPRRRHILEGLLELRMEYADGELIITGQVPVSESASAAGTPGKKCHSRIDADPLSYQPIPFILKRRVA